MKIVKLDHVNIRTTNLAAMIDWYVDTLGLHSGARPNFPFNGAWLYAGDAPIIHLVEVDNEAVGSEAKLKLEHFALKGTGRTEFEAQLENSGETFEVRKLPEFNLAQYYVWDPDGNRIHVDFPLDA